MLVGDGCRLHAVCRLVENRRTAGNANIENNNVATPAKTANTTTTNAGSTIPSHRALRTPNPRSVITIRRNLTSDPRPRPTLQIDNGTPATHPAGRLDLLCPFLIPEIHVPAARLLVPLTCSAAIRAFPTRA